MNLKPVSQSRAWLDLITIAAKLPQCLIFTGPAGVGKKRAAQALFQYLNCTNPPLDLTEPAPCGGCIQCKKIAAGHHTDYIEIAPVKENIPVDALREMKKALNFAPVESKLRFVVIDDAHKLNAFSANSILKTLEEPPVHTRFFLITHERSLLLPTIVSRAQFVQFEPLDDSTLKELLVEHKISIPESLGPMCFALMAGGMGKANRFSDPKTFEFLESLLRLNTKSDTLTALAEELSAASAEWKLELFLDWLMVENHGLLSQNQTHLQLYQACTAALEAAFLRRRLDRSANKKLVAFAAAQNYST